MNRSTLKAILCGALALLAFALAGIFANGNVYANVRSSTPTTIVSVDSQPTACADYHGERYCNVSGDTESAVRIAP